MMSPLEQPKYRINVKKKVMNINLDFIRKYLLRNTLLRASQVNNSACTTKQRKQVAGCHLWLLDVGWFKFYNDQVGQGISFACSEQQSLPLGRLGQFHIRAWLSQ